MAGERAAPSHTVRQMTIRARLVGPTTPLPG
jgi:hypothetical protein